jgi:hypothetical protein
VLNCFGKEEKGLLLVSAASHYAAQNKMDSNENDDDGPQGMFIKFLIYLKFNLI